MSFRKSRAEMNIVKNCKIKFHRRVRGSFLDFDNNLCSKSTIYTLCGPLGPDVDATVKIQDPTYINMEDRKKTFPCNVTCYESSHHSSECQNRVQTHSFSLK